MVIKTNNRRAPDSNKKDKKEDVISKTGVATEDVGRINKFNSEIFLGGNGTRSVSMWLNEFKEFMVKREYKSKFEHTPEAVYCEGEPITLNNSVTRTLRGMLRSSLMYLENPNELLMLYYTKEIFDPTNFVITRVLDNFNKYMLGIYPDTKDASFLAMPNRDSFKKLIVYVLWYLNDDTIPKGESKNKLEIEDYLTDFLIDSVIEYLNKVDLPTIELLKYMLEAEGNVDVAEDVYVKFFVRIEDYMITDQGRIQLIDLFKEQVWDNLINKN